MRCPTLKELPNPPSDKTGWPWTEESMQLPDTMPDCSPWPKISIVTPSLNQGQYIEETIRSVLLQGYPDLEYIIIDGGSTDDSVEIISKYEKWLTYWVSEHDRGQSHAINKGFARATGEIFGYINSDDLYENEALKTILLIFGHEKLTQFIAGSCTFFEENNIEGICEASWPGSMTYFLNPLGLAFAQPASFWQRQLFEKLQGFDEGLNYIFDREFFLRVGLAGITPKIIPNILARYRVHQATKFKSQLFRFFDESPYVVTKHGKGLGLSEIEQKKWIKRIMKEWKYKEVFVVWKYEGRWNAITTFIQMVFNYPTMLLERRVIGLARRLITHRQNKVAEIAKF